MTAPSFLGVLFAMVFYAISVTPSLLPRRWWWHAFVSGIVMGLGYVIGWGLEEGGRALLEIVGVHVSMPEVLWRWMLALLALAVLAWTLRSVWNSYRAGREAAEMQGMKPVGPGEYFLGFVLSFGMFAFVMQVVRLVLLIFNQAVNLLGRWMYQPLAVLLSLAFVVLVIVVVSNKVVFKFGMAVYAHKAAKLNTTSGGGYAQPLVAERSGSPESLSPWETIGGQGRKFLCKGPSAQMIADVTGAPAMEPVRIYVGMPRRGADLEELAALAVEEMDRTGAFDRSVVLVNTATGSGWVDEWLVQPMEYLTHGDCAVVTMQYSYLFSAAMMVSDLTDCALAGQYLFELVEARVKAMPPKKRPLLIVSGESLGAYGSQMAFVDFDDLRRRTDGGIWTGSPYKSPILREITERRAPGSPEVSPLYDEGRHLRVVNEPAQLKSDIFGRGLGEWEFPRFALVQHASDPVVFYTPRLGFHEPDWIRERVGLDVSKGMRYTPVTTYLQVLTDLPVAGTAPAGHGHTYHRELVDVWMEILGFDRPHALGRVGSTAWVTPEMKAAIGDAIEKDNQRDP